jgi:hypothetical protein
VTAFSRHLASFVILDGSLEREREGERVPHIVLARRIAGEAADAQPFVSGEVWERDGTVIAATGALPDGLTAESAEPLIRAAFPEHQGLEVRLGE